MWFEAKHWTQNTNKVKYFINFWIHPSNFITSLKYENQSGELKALLSNLANVYWLTYKPTKNALKKHGILKRLCSNKDMVITRSDKGSGIIILGETFYEEKILKLISDVNKFK